MILTLAGILFVLMVFIGGERGLKSFTVLIMNVVIGIISFYLIISNVPVILVMLGSSILFCFLTILYQNGFSVKILASLISISIIIAFMTILIYIICIWGHYSGFNEIERYEGDAGYLTSIVSFKMRSLFIMALVWGQLGAISDTAVSVSSALYEIYFHNPDFDRTRLFKEGIIIGKDILGTTVNTLFFVAMGESIMMLLYYEVYRYSYVDVLNSSSFSEAVLPILLPCIGCILIIPLSSFVCSLLIKRTSKTKE